jgi:TonB family protein
VRKSGNVTDVAVAKPSFGLLDEEALRVISGMAYWKPGTNNNIAVDVRMVIPIKFEILQK